MEDKIIIIAEAGVNHNGSLQNALSLVDAAADAGADYVKFQTFNAANLVTHAAAKAEYQKQNTGNDDSQLEMLRKLELTADDHYRIMEHCRERGIRFLSTAFDLESVEMLHEMHLDLWKIPSGEITNYPYLRKIAGYNEKVVMSTGMCSVEDVRVALKALADNGQDMSEVTLLHCNTQYPTPMEDVNLRAMNALRELSPSVGYSDHTVGIEIPIAAAALGAKVIEKHFTLSRDMPGPDHKASLEPDELKAMVRSIRNIEKALGDGMKRVSPSESVNREIARKSIVASCHISKGEVLTEMNMTAKRPGTGISPMRWLEVEGTVAKRDYEPDEQIEL